ncbi:MAG: tetraacyldisaccharide 4'-kinase [Colwellia sp.]|nr:tetraacyldisaccharide 4'-kinase [Colwellia sp.]
MRLIEKVWFKSHASKWIIVPLLLPLAALFAVISKVRRYCYSTNIFKSYRVDKPVVVVGNIGIGGNGKTPVVVLLVQLCQELGLTPGVISRGYGGNAPNYPYLLNNKSSTDEAGDEPILIYQRCKVPVVVGADRVANADLLISQGCDIILADDGLQHYRLKRDIEIIVVDGKRLFGNGLLLPAGPLREGLWRLKTADFVINNGGNKEKVINEEMVMNLNANFVCHLVTGERKSLTEFISQHKVVNAMAGIGSPERFFNTLAELDFEVIHSKGFVDHHNFSLIDFGSFDNDLPLLMTEKDAVKCQPFAMTNWWYLPVDAVIAAIELEQIKTKLKQLTI